MYDDARAQFNEKELADLTLAIAAINAWNRLSIATDRFEPTLNYVMRRGMQQRRRCRETSPEP